MIERQMPSQIQLGGTEEVIQQTIDSVSNGSKVAVVSNLTLNIFLAASLNQLWSMINTQ